MIEQSLSFNDTNTLLLLMLILFFLFIIITKGPTLNIYFDDFLLQSKKMLNVMKRARVKKKIKIK